VRRDSKAILSLLKHLGQVCMPVTVLDLDGTVDELVSRAAEESQKTKAEIRELIARDVQRRTVACTAGSVA
jgi:hypothetical protein